MESATAIACVKSTNYDYKYSGTERNVKIFLFSEVYEFILIYLQLRPFRLVAHLLSQIPLLAHLALLACPTHWLV